MELGKKFTLEHVIGKKAGINAHAIGRKLTTVGTFAGYAAPIVGAFNPVAGAGLEGVAIGSSVLGHTIHRLANAAQ